MFKFNPLDIKNINPEDVPESVIESAFQNLKEFCEEENRDMHELVADEANIPFAAEEIHKRLGLAYRTVLKKKTIEELLTKNIDYIRQKVAEYGKQEKALVAKNKAIDDLDNLF